MKSERPAAAALRILHLEDDPLDGEFLQVNLREAGLQCDILRVDTKSGFVTALQEREFDLVISDLSLPAFNGMAALEIVRERYPDIPFIFVSGTIGEEAAIDSLLSGATDYVLKHRFARLVPAVQRVMRDAEERKRRRKTEQQLALASTQLHNLFDNLDDVFISLDAVQNRLLQISPSCERISGWPSRAFLDDARLWEKCVFEHDLAGFSDVVSSLRVGKSVQEQFRAVHRDGTVRWIEARLKPVIDHVGKLVRIDGILSDVSERKNAEEALRASEERYRLLFENNPHPMWVYDAQTLGFLAVNDAAVEAYGYDRTEFLQMTVPDIRETIEGGSTQQHKKKDGTRIEVEIASHGFVFSGRDAKLILANDVTEKKKIEAQLMRSQRVETIGTLASGIAHDLNNILAPILMGTQLLRERSRDERDRQTLETLELSTRRGADLVKQVLAFARGIESRRGTLQVRHLLRDVEKILGETLPKSIQLVDEVAANLWPVSGDSTQLNQLFMNLCINARDAMAAGGVLTVSARNSEIAGTQNLKTTGLKEGFYVVVEVADTGDGIPEDLLNKIFEPFFTTKQDGKGTGLGLATVQMVVKNHGGFLQVSTEVGRGTKFSVYLPASPTQSVTADDKVNAPSLGHGELILIVDDEAAIRQIAKTTLEAYGYRVITAANGAEGLIAFREHSAEISVILSDMNMPIMDGGSMLEMMEKIKPELRVVAASGMPKTHECPPAAVSKRKVSLRKPFTAMELLNAITTVLHAL